MPLLLSEPLWNIYKLIETSEGKEPFLLIPVLQYQLTNALKKTAALSQRDEVT